MPIVCGVVCWVLAGKCAANLQSTELNFDAPKDLLNLDVFHKRSTARNVEAMSAGRFSTAPRSNTTCLAHGL